MNTQSKSAWLVISFILCALLVLLLGWTSWHFYQKSKKLEYKANSNLVGSSQLNIANKNNALDEFFAPFSSQLIESNRLMSKTFDSFLNSRPMDFSALSNHLFQSPNIHLEENDQEYKVIIEHLDGKNVELNTEISDGVLFISGKVNEQLMREENNRVTQSAFSSEFNRSFVLDKPVDEAKMTVKNDKSKTVVIVPKMAS